MGAEVGRQLHDDARREHELLDAGVRGRFSAAIRRASLDWTAEDGCPHMAMPEIFLFLFC